MLYTLEVIAFSLESCRQIELGGAQRIELCANAAEGGTTPSYGLIRAAREGACITLFPMIRPRGGDFLYSEEEYAAMLEDVRRCRELGCDGVVTGLLLRDGQVDAERTGRLVEAAYPLEVTFHRAFDHCRDPFEALEVLVRAGCRRILTSGQQPTAPEGAELIRRLVQSAAGRITIMPGSGVRPHTIRSLAEQTGAREFHASLRSPAPSRMAFVHPAFAAIEESYTHPAVTAGAVKELKQALYETATEGNLP